MAQATLTEFLLARITEDEAAWSGGAGLAVFARMSRHMLADYEAKRAIVQECWLCEKDDFKPGTETWGYREALRGSVQALAVPYSDHPDYQQEWKP